MHRAEGEKAHEAHKKKEPLDYNYITDGIYLGANQCCEMGLVDVLKKEGVTIDISLEKDRIDSPYGVLSYMWLPVADNTSPALSQFDLGVGVLEMAVQQKKKVYIHCKNGHGRSTTLLMAYLIKKGHIFEDAWELIKKERPVIHLSHAQKKGLLEYTEHIRE